MIQLKMSEISHIRDIILKEQDGNCAICNEKIDDLSGVSLDHQHKTKKEEIGVDGGGLIRGVLCRSCNLLEGKLWNNTARFKNAKTVQDRIDFLESLVLYYKKDNYDYIHPSEKNKEPKVSKRNYNKLQKIYNKRAKFPEYPKSGKLSKRLKELFEEYNISPWN